MKALQFMLKFRKGALCVCCGASVLVIWAGLAHMGSPWVLVALASLPALYHHCAVQCERNIGRCLQQLGKQTTHHAARDGSPSNAAWDAAVRDVYAKGHLHYNLEATYSAKIDHVILTFE